MTPRDPREDESAAAVDERLTRWLASRGVRAAACERLAGDVSTRQYFRLEVDGRTFVAAFYPRELAAAQLRFVAAARLLAGAGVRVPAIELDDPDAGFALVEDVGPATLHQVAGAWEERPRELAATLEAARRIAALPAAEVAALGSPPLDAELLARELAATVELLLAPRGLDGGGMAEGLAELCRRAGREPLVSCHRDLMARNLVPDGDGGVVVLDFQDLRLGPPAYDLASLLNDSFFAGAGLERELCVRLGYTGERADDYRRAVVQRTLKAAGTYLRFAARGFRRHLPLVGPTLARALPHLAELPETRAPFRAARTDWERAAAGDWTSIC